MQLSFRKYEDQDFAYCNALLESNMSHYFELADIQWDTKRYRKEIATGKVRIVSSANGTVGFLHMSNREMEAYVHTIQIDPTYHNRGIGTQMLNWIEDAARKDDQIAILLSVFKDSPALRLYKRLRYTIIEDRNSKYLMKKQL